MQSKVASLETPILRPNIGEFANFANYIKSFEKKNMSFVKVSINVVRLLEPIFFYIAYFNWLLLFSPCFRSNLRRDIFSQRTRMFLCLFYEKLCVWWDLENNHHRHQQFKCSYVMFALSKFRMACDKQKISITWIYIRDNEKLTLSRHNCRIKMHDNRQNTSRTATHNINRIEVNNI